MNYIINNLAVISIALNTLTGGSYRNTFSARSGYAFYIQDKRWAGVSVKLIDFAFGENHCYQEWQNERDTFSK